MLIIITITFIIGIIIGIRIAKGDDVLGFIGAVIGALSAYIILKIEKGEDQKKEEKIKCEELEYKNQMLYTLIYYTLCATAEEYSILEEQYFKFYNSILRDAERMNKEFDPHFKLNKNLNLDIIEILLLGTWIK